MEKKNFFCCSCFIDQAFWYINSCNFTWEFDQFIYKNGVMSDNVFIYDKTFEIISTGDSFYYKSCITVCCLNCIEFTIRFLSDNEDFTLMLTDVDCQFVFEDVFSFNSVIYYGNDRFQFDESKNPFCVEKILEKYISKFPEHKSCFTSLGKFYFRYFCYNCREAFMKIIPKNFYGITNGLNRK